ncbi:hypothetical protein [Aliiroseovarius sp. S253]|uniref:hypothetical protein n=1 Tax=Aliiroseovarius sp. S253 TaxID=3415133 RepID=UPI003C7A92ED
MPKFILHIGSHKTGTSSLQTVLQAAHDHGQLSNWSYLTPPPKKHFRQNLVQIKGPKQNFKTEINYRRFKRMIAHDGDCIVSIENFFWIDNQQQIEKLAKIIRRRFDDIRIVAYLRRQDSLALSHRKQAVMRFPTSKFYGTEITALPRYKPALDNYFCYDRKLQLWINAFGADSLIVRKFERDALFKGDTIADFFRLLDLPDPDQSAAVNSAWPRKKLLTGLYLRSKEEDGRSIRKILRRIEDTEKLTPSRADAEAFLNHFQESNQRLAEMLGDNDAPYYFDTDLSRYPDVGNDNVTEAEIEQWIAESLHPQTA